ncbi:phosphatase PAP2 family protein [Mycobacterium noviomagense]|uniref:Phosphatase PAP2 family protein n=2 Tax=Mycobacterium noviomagense TaxID=459858 RepID=A0ABX3T1G3_9MYCO|nr:phosphatase PAP2 family protein [Mycobacterium noviomagense]ORB11417.1 phosphatase PAP2 family protein [Mycobacterium noviomagense]
MPSLRSTVVTVAMAVLAAVVYAVMWVGYRHGWGWLGSADTSSLQALYDVGVKHPLWVRFWDVVCTVFSPGAFELLGVVAAVVALAKRLVREALFLVAVTEFNELITHVAKHLAHRPRPATPLVHASSSSFPSGHAVGAMAVVLALLTMLFPILGRSMRVVAAAVGVLIVVAVGFGRVALNVHHVSDVVAGWALGYLYFLLCALAFRPRALTRAGALRR